jgi:hypothetical protein
MLHHHQGYAMASGHLSTEYSRLPWRKASNLLEPHGWLLDLRFPGARVAMQAELVRLNTLLRPDRPSKSNSLTVEQRIA